MSTRREGLSDCDPRHGTSNGYLHYGCRCGACSDHMAAIKRARRERVRSSQAAGDFLTESRPCIICSAPVYRIRGEWASEFKGRTTCGSRDCMVAATISRRWQPDPHAVGARTLLAKSCKECGCLLMAREFKVDHRDGSRSGVCTRCIGRRSYARMDSTAKSELLTRQNQKISARNRETQPSATRSGLQWTGPELEIVSRDDLTISELAEMLGRTYQAVTRARMRVRREPKERWLAGAGPLS